MVFPVIGYSVELD